MRFSQIRLFDIINGEGIRVSLFLSGCKFRCKGCFNKECQNFNCGSEFTGKEYSIILDKLSDEKFDGLSLLGGDPLWQDEKGLQVLIKLVDDVQMLGKNVWLWSGFSWEEIMSTRNSFLDILRQTLIKKSDVFIDGLFEQDKKVIDLLWRGSSNQRIIDVKKSLDKGEIVLYAE